MSHDFELVRKHKKAEKKCCEENMRQTAASFHKLIEDTGKIRSFIDRISHQRNNLHSTAKALKSSVVQV